MNEFANDFVANARPAPPALHGAPLQRLSAAEAFARRKRNPFGVWPLVDNPDNRFAILAAPHYRSSFVLEPGQKIFTIGSCFARNIESELAERGFEIPTRAFAVDKSEWVRDPGELLNNYVPGAVTPQIRWAFGLEKYDLDIHGVELAPGRYIDPYLAPASRPIPAREILARRESLDTLYRQLATSDAIVITLGYVEAWFDRKSGYYVNAPPPIAILRSAPERFELHVLDYDQVYASLEELIALMNRVCPKDYRIILTVSPAPLHLTFTDDDISVANTYSKSVLRAAAGAICARHAHIDYFPSYESVMLSQRDKAFADDQIHVSQRIVRFNIDRMLQQYVIAPDEAGSSTDIIDAARRQQQQGHYGSALLTLKTAWARNREDLRLTVALARMYHTAGLSSLAISMLEAPHVEQRNDPQAMLLLAKIFNRQGRHAEAAAIAEKVAATGKAKLATALERAEAYYVLGRFEEGHAMLARLGAVDERNALKVVLWKARFLEKLSRFDEADAFFRQVNCEAEDFEFLLAYAQFLAARGRFDEAREWLRRALGHKPYDLAALQLQATIAAPVLAGAAARARRFGIGSALAYFRRLVVRS